MAGTTTTVVLVISSAEAHAGIEPVSSTSIAANSSETNCRSIASTRLQTSTSIGKDARTIFLAVCSTEAHTRLQTNAGPVSSSSIDADSSETNSRSVTSTDHQSSSSVNENTSTVARAVSGPEGHTILQASTSKASTGS
ncbi:hypothetical protein MRX96_026492 [Rhipicephalus microplus]